ncbi:YkgJ family cysteine cluster protein [Thiorhodococcus mannitoliphagus]|uniref:YkgJ family cysteine cluster protein n=1 Tax=Thiorhodococcus mannitoliphagus TaxID=329406 RepID=A0A6P1DUS8_9GAMM|nr:YkgJ family cysteine cluster protein [Thiorhodococcus mannitoliphagus]NEX21230.1 YkgJ family cysteine cluster protein [Thiorhodococcus mannitoliphagus]
MTDTPARETTSIRCDTCAAACCRLEVICLSDGDIPERYTTENAWGNTMMARLEDGWCAALDRDTMRCRIYAERPLGCRELELGGEDCLAERARCHG